MPLLPLKLLLSGAALVACAPSSSLSVGLANAPSAQYGLPVAAADTRNYDAIANGLDSCDREAAGTSPLRGRLPPCPRAERSSTDEPTFAPHQAALPAIEPHMPCWAAADPWPQHMTRASVAMCGRACSPTLVACNY
jgi:hypothetical protein